LKECLLLALRDKSQAENLRSVLDGKRTLVDSALGPTCSE
jgi:hypothetical protein